MADATADILLRITSNLEGILKAQEAFKDLQNAAKVSQGSIAGANDEVKSFGATFREQFMGSVGLGAGFTVGAAAAMGVVTAVRAIGAEIKNVLTEGVMFNAEMEQAKLGVAAALRTFDPEKYSSFQDALAASGTVIDLLKQKSVQFGLSFAPLAEQYTATVGAMFKGGITDIQKQIDLTVTLNRTMGTLGISGFRAIRDIADILNGVANRTIAGRSLGISDEDLKAASDAGQLYEYLNQKLGAFGEAVNAGQQNIQVLQERLKSTVEQNAAANTQELTEAYRSLLQSLIALTNSDAFKHTVRFLSVAASATVGQFADLADSISGRGSKLSGPEASVAAGQKAYASLDSQANSVGSDKDNDAAMFQAQRNLRDLQANREAANGDKGPMGAMAVMQLDELIAKTKDRLSLIEKEGQKQVQINQAKAQAAQLEGREAQATKEADEARSKELKKTDELNVKAQQRIETGLKEIDKQEYINKLLFDRDSLTRQMKGPDSRSERYLAGAESADPSKQKEARQAAANFVAEKEGEIAKIDGEIATTRKAMDAAADAAAKKAEAAAKKAAEQADKDLAKSRAIEAEETARQSKAATDAIRDNDYLTERQKKQLLFVAYKKEEAQIADQIAAQQKLVDTEPDGSATKAQAQAQLKSLKDRQEVTLPKEEAEVAPTSNLQDMTKALTQFASQAKSVGTSIADVINGSLNSIGSNLTALIMKTKDWKQAFSSVARTVVTDLVQSGISLVTGWIKNELSMTAATLTGTSARTAATNAGTTASVAGTVLTTTTHVAGEATKTGATLMGGAIRIGVTIKEALASIYNAAAGAMSAMASIPYVGPILAVAAMAAILGLGIGLVAKIGKGFSKGGYTGDGSVNEPAGEVHKGEVVFSQANVAAHGGVAAVEALRVSGRGGYGAASPVVASSAATQAPTEGNSSPSVHFAQFNTKQDAEQWLRTRKGRRVMQDFQTQQASEA